MATPTATLAGPLPIYDSRKANALNKVNISGINHDDFRFNGELTRIYFYNVSTVEYKVSRPPNFPRKVVFKGRPRDKEYVLCSVSLSHPFVEFREDVNNNRFPTYTNGFREATKLLCPLNPGIDQNFDDPTSVHQGGNLNRLGVFWSTNFPPLREELEAAQRRLEDTYRSRIEAMTRIEESDGAAEASRRAGRIDHAAADWSGQSFSWHRSDLMVKQNAGKVDCGACGEKIQPSARICKECGAPTDPKLLEAWLAEKFGNKPAAPAAPAGRRKVTINPDEIIDFKA